ncbi:MAG: DUF1501 domain-containing protein [Pseudomonadales bacterium]
MKSRRSLIRQSGLWALGSTLFGPWSQYARAAAMQSTAAPSQRKPILVVVELSGGNDGLNTVVPHGNDRYYQLRPGIGISAGELLPIDEMWGFNPGALGFKRLWDTGDLAIVHGCGYDAPSYSHFTSAAYWHTAAPNSGADSGWIGRTADAALARGTPNPIINIGSAQSLAVKSRIHTPVVFDEPERFQRSLGAGQGHILDRLNQDSRDDLSSSTSTAYVRNVARSAQAASRQVQAAWRSYRPAADYGIAPMDLPKVAACIAGGLNTQLYHVSFRNNAFDTHVQQPALHRRLLSYACDGIHGFIRDLEQIGRADDVCVLVYSEFGRRAAENTNRGTDHGSANCMFLAGKPVRGGHYGEAPSLARFNAEDNLLHTVDFRRVYASVIEQWLAPGQSQAVLGAQFDSLPLLDPHRLS